MFFIPDWPAPSNVKCLITRRDGGVSQGEYSSLNLAAHVGDNPADVQANRELLRRELHNNFALNVAASTPNLNCIPWLTQVHGVDILDVDSLVEPLELDVKDQNVKGQAEKVQTVFEADGAMSSRSGHVCAVLSADCLPVLMCDKQGTQVAAIHAGWQGMAKGILSCAIDRFTCSPADILCYFGPAISVKHFEVGADVVCRFQASAMLRSYKTPIEKAFHPSNNLINGSIDDEPKWFGDLYALARSELEGKGVVDIYGGNDCSYNDKDAFFSYRRDQTTGRMASLIWLA